MLRFSGNPLWKPALVALGPNGWCNDKQLVHELHCDLKYLSQSHVLIPAMIKRIEDCFSMTSVSPILHAFYLARVSTLRRLTDFSRDMSATRHHVQALRC